MRAFGRATSAVVELKWHFGASGGGAAFRSLAAVPGQAARRGSRGPAGRAAPGGPGQGGPGPAARSSSGLPASASPRGGPPAPPGEGEGEV